MFEIYKDLGIFCQGCSCELCHFHKCHNTDKDTLFQKD